MDWVSCTSSLQLLSSHAFVGQGTSASERLAHHARAAQEIFGIVVDSVAADNAVGDAFSAEENIFVGDVAAGIGFVEDFAARAVPIDFAVGFLHAVGAYRGGRRRSFSLRRRHCAGKAAQKVERWKRNVKTRTFSA